MCCLEILKTINPSVLGQKINAYLRVSHINTDFSSIVPTDAWPTNPLREY